MTDCDSKGKEFFFYFAYILFAVRLQGTPVQKWSWKKEEKSNNNNNKIEVNLIHHLVIRQRLFRLLYHEYTSCIIRLHPRTEVQSFQLQSLVCISEPQHSRFAHSIARNSHFVEQESKDSRGQGKTTYNHFSSQSHSGRSPLERKTKSILKRHR